MQRISEYKSWLSEKINKIVWPWAQLTKRKDVDELNKKLTGKHYDRCQKSEYYNTLKNLYSIKLEI